MPRDSPGRADTICAPGFSRARPRKSIADQLPPEIALQIHPDRSKNESAYWAVWDLLLDQYREQWIGFADGVVIVSGSRPVTVLHAADASGHLTCFICVGGQRRTVPHPSRSLRAQRELSW